MKTESSTTARRSRTNKALITILIVGGLGILANNSRNHSASEKTPPTNVPENNPIQPKLRVANRGTEQARTNSASNPFVAPTPAENEQNPPREVPPSSVASYDPARSQSPKQSSVPERSDSSGDDILSNQAIRFQSSPGTIQDSAISTNALDIDFTPLRLPSEIVEVNP